MKKLFLFALLSVFGLQKVSACADYDPESDYYNLFMQDVINSPQYYPFLMSYGSGFYSVSNTKDAERNENIEQWQKYLGINYNDAKYLVFDTNQETLRNLAAGKPSANAKLKFANVLFTTKYKQALLYLAYAKYLEPYMSISISGDNEWYRSEDKTANQLDYTKVIGVLQKSWSAETDKELKLRYGFQLVRFTHYNRNYAKAISYFDTYVEPLNYKPAMYYHALNHKAGAQRGLGYKDEANYNFLKVFVNSKNLKENAFNSINLTEDMDWQNLLKKTKTTNEVNDAYLLLGYSQFNNPISSLEKIAAKSPDAIQAKVLMARAVNSIERTYNMSGYYCWEGNCFDKAADKRYPITRDEDKAESDDFLAQTLKLSVSMAEKATDKNFWNLTSAYLYFINKDFGNAKSYLSKVKPTDSKYTKQKNNFSMLIDICQAPVITSDLEIAFSEKYKSVLNREFTPYSRYNEGTNISDYNTHAFVMDVLANRYFIQKDYAKSFLLNNNILTLENNPRLDLLADIEAFYKKPNKNALEKMIESKMYPFDSSGKKLTSAQLDMQSYIDYMRGNIYLAMGNLDQSLASYTKVKPTFDAYYSTWGEGSLLANNDGYTGFRGVSSLVFGYNRIECFDCGTSTTMANDYVKDFAFIKSNMNKKELVENLIQLKKIGESNNLQGAKANYLIGSFFYNVTRTGFYRHLLRFDQTNGMCEKYRLNEDKDVFNGIYFKGYNTYYKDDVSLPEQYLQKAYKQASDDELKAKVIFALSKCEQEAFYNEHKIDGLYWSDDILIKDRKYFGELAKYSHTAFYNEVKSNCLYFDYYVKNY